MAWIRACGGGSPAVLDGKTVTPINDVTIWQKCAGIANPTYTTLAEVLADTGILSTLMASNNAVDYLARSKQFIGSLALVPTMTSDSTPSGECGATTTDPADHPYYAFDGNNATAWDPYKGGTAVNGEKVWYHFPSAVRCSKAVFGLKNSTVVGRVNELEIVGSNDGTNWTVLGSKSAGFAVDNNEIACNGANEYSYLGLNIKDGTDTIYIAYLQFSFDGIVNNSNAMTYIGQNNYASNTLLADSDWRDAICNSTYFESVLNVKVPTMTSNTTPSGVASASSSSSYWQPWYAFNPDGEWISASGTSNQHITYDFGVDRDIKMCMAKFTTSSSIGGGYAVTPSNITLKSSQDNNTFTDISTVIATSAIPSGRTTDIIFSSIARGRAFRCLVNGYNTAYDGNTCVINQLQFYGREDV